MLSSEGRVNCTGRRWCALTLHQSPAFSVVGVVAKFEDAAQRAVHVYV